ncbi:hypothetical protein DZF93_04080 [Clavibacter michiganensis subsp. insidiosus]|uniref:Uncharacterized protein n=1 Tax=Clavibacter michiganensis subsp. insidiosus TaxID=33014 RepID=A0A0D5CM36_9MICO|nr:hypothetical protein VO01_15805 [Clavibacter michiganensis subsp. insidiosus]AWF99898.1 hypothetical protein BEH61_15440 [Clavibacter michiganensis subsp. insidiosus]OQJ57012.1 hypothetical protein B5P21_15670 [Clavibacter michiganensis subsp. insidiosus]OQJ57070.1 hypothetical protein B5P21_16005 [Clavibacter michiganensis subsp. insidiosus]RIJ44109.1 hypothetical protein DZF93_04080 [Clavibacter michiganensis subsp. insidiosus]
MPWTGLQLLYAAMELVGMLLTLGGLIAISRGAKVRYLDAREKLARALELNEEEETAKAREPGRKREIIAEFQAHHLANGLPRRAGYGESFQPGYETESVMRVLGAGAGRDLVIASIGLVLSGTAGVLATLFPAN